MKLKRHIDFINESDLTKSVASMNKFGMKPEINFSFDVIGNIEYAEEMFGMQATGPSYPWIPIKVVRKYDEFVFLLESEDETKMKTVVVKNLIASRDNRSDLEIEDSMSGNHIQEFEDDGYDMYWFDVDSIKENDNLNKSMHSMGKFGMFPIEELTERIKNLLTEHMFAPNMVKIYEDTKEVNIWFFPGSSLKKDIKEALSGDEMITTYYDLDNIHFENQGDEHAYILVPHGSDVEQQEKATPKEIAQDIVDNSDIDHEDLDDLRWNLDEYLPNTSYEVDESDYDEIVKYILDIMGYDEDEDEDDEDEDDY